MDRYAVLGQPVAHSLSPKIHAAFATQLGAELDYGAIEVAPVALGEVLRRLHAERYAGLNLTLPLKVDAIAQCETISERARLAGACNTLIRTHGGWRGDNTDGAGLLRDLTANVGFRLRGRRVLLLGAGGAARGVLAPLLTSGVAELVVSNRTPWKPESLVAPFTASAPIRPATHLALKGDCFDLVIDATAAGHQGLAPRLPPGLLAGDALAYTLNYGAAAQPFLGWARDNGAARAADGLGMLVEQAAEAFSLWRGVRPETGPVLAALRAV